MEMIDFEYDGERASDYGLMIGSLNDPDEEVDIGNKITINKVKAQNSDKYYAVNSDYDDCLSLEIGVVKNPCHGDDGYFTDTEINHIVQWLNRKSFYKFKPIYRDPNEFMDVFVEGTFNVDLVKIGGSVVGFNLTLNTNSPYCYSEPVEFSYSFYQILTTENYDELTVNTGDDTFLTDVSVKHTSTGDVVNEQILETEDSNELTVGADDDIFLIDASVEPAFTDSVSNENGYIYVDAVINVWQDGDLIISNENDTNDVVINNCKNGDVIKLYGDLKIIECPTHLKLYNDFNYNFLRLLNTYKNSENKLSSNLICDIKLTYTPIKKVGLVL